MEHHLIVLHKFGEATGLPLRQATCSCGWKAGVWYVTEGLLHESYDRHTRALAEGSTVPWMLAPGGAA